MDPIRIRRVSDLSLDHGWHAYGELRDELWWAISVTQHNGHGRWRFCVDRNQSRVRAATDMGSWSRRRFYFRQGPLDWSTITEDRIRAAVPILLDNFNRWWATYPGQQPTSDEALAEESRANSYVWRPRICDRSASRWGREKWLLTGR